MDSNHVTNEASRYINPSILSCLLLDTDIFFNSLFSYIRHRD